jgi:hypothetical protein
MPRSILLALISVCRVERKDDPAPPVQFCANCGSTTHVTLIESAASRFGNILMGVNMRLADENDLAGIEMGYADGQAWSGLTSSTMCGTPASWRKKR